MTAYDEAFAKDMATAIAASLVDPVKNIEDEDKAIATAITYSLLTPESIFKQFDHALGDYGDVRIFLATLVFMFEMIHTHYTHGLNWIESVCRYVSYNRSIEHISLLLGKIRDNIGDAVDVVVKDMFDNTMTLITDTNNEYVQEFLRGCIHPLIFEVFATLNRYLNELIELNKRNNKTTK